MKITFHNSFLTVKELFILTLLLSTFTVSIQTAAQTGSYEKKLANGAYAAFSIQKTGNEIKAEAFSWWNTANAKMGHYYGEGVLNKNTVTLKTEENEPDCKINLTLVQGQLQASFANCFADRFPEDFNGLYTKITDAVAGDYKVTISKAYFYKKPDNTSKLNTYVIQDDTVTLDIENITACNQQWVFVSYTSKTGKQTTGYLPLSALKPTE